MSGSQRRSGGEITPTPTDDGLHTCFCSPHLDSRTGAVILPSMFYANTVTLRFEEALSMSLVDTRPPKPPMFRYVALLSSIAVLI